MMLQIKMKKEALTRVCDTVSQSDPKYLLG